MKTNNMRAPFPYFGGKSRVAPDVWARLGNCPNYVEPFFGSGAVLLARPDNHEWWKRIETVNDADGLLSNFWRAVKHDPDGVAEWADWPVNENDLHARHSWLVGRKEDITRRLEGDPDYYDAKVAGWWVWGISTWIAGQWCGGTGPWVVGADEEGYPVLVRVKGSGGQKRSMPHLGNKGTGVNVTCYPTSDVYDKANGICATRREFLMALMNNLSNRLRHVRVCCGDWSRITRPSSTVRHGLTGVFLDPPYSFDERDSCLYNKETDCAKDVLQWALTNGDNPMLRIALCGYDGEHNVLEDYGWDVHAWKAAGGYGSRSNGRGRANSYRERIWFSPHCLQPNVGPAQKQLLT